MNANDFQVVKVIGRGAFGEVQLVSNLSPVLTLRWIYIPLKSEFAH